jgi:hypothetical protein
VPIANPSVEVLQRPLEFTQGDPHRDVTGAADSTYPVGLARLVALGRQPETGTHRLGAEPLGPVDGGSEGECHDGADPGHGHQLPAGLVCAGDVPHPLVEDGKLGWRGPKVRVRSRRLVGGTETVLAELVGEQNDATLAEYAERLAARTGVRRSLA